MPLTHIGWTTALASSKLLLRKRSTDTLASSRASPRKIHTFSRKIHNKKVHITERNDVIAVVFPIGKPGKKRFFLKKYLLFVGNWHLPCPDLLWQLGLELLGKLLGMLLLLLLLLLRGRRRYHLVVQGVLKHLEKNCTLFVANVHRFPTPFSLLPFLKFKDEFLQG